MRSVVIIEDDPDLRFLLRLHFGADAEFEVRGEAAAVDEGLRQVASEQPDLVVLDNRLEGEVTGIVAAPLLEALVPHAKIVLFSASEELRVPAAAEPAIDAFLLKTQMHRLVPLSRQLLGLDPTM